jgi:hypothetical protein
VSKDYTKRVKELAAYYKVERGSKSLPEWMKAIKKAAGHEFMGMEELYALTFKPKGAKESAAAEKTTDAVGKEDAEDIKVVRADEVLPPVSHSHRVEVAAPTIQVCLPPTVVHAASVRDLRLVEIGQRLCMHVFVFGSGMMFGVLMSGAVLKRLAVVAIGGP